MSHPLVVHRRHGQHDVYIGRPSKWGNPIVMRGEDDREHAVREYAEHLTRNPDLIADARRELRGKVLGCYCAPKLCHGDVLARVAAGASPAGALEAALAG